MPRYRVGYLPLFLLLTALLLVLSLVDLIVGPYTISMGDILSYLLRGPDVSKATTVVIGMRLRRVLTAIAAGGLLGTSGYVVQANLRNPLASPFTLGIQHAAALGAGVGILVLGGGGVVGPRSATSATILIANPFTVSILAFGASMLHTALVLTLAYVTGLTIYSIILVALALSFTVQAVLALLQYLVFNEIQVATLMFWTFGSVERTSWLEVEVLLVAYVVMAVATWVVAPDLDLMLLGDDIASSSGVNPRVFRAVSMSTAALATALTISFVGVVGFVCLVSGHIARLVFGWSARRSGLASGLVGGLTMLAADVISRTVISPVTLPIGITTTIVGVPVLIALVLGGGRGYTRD